VGGWSARADGTLPGRRSAVSGWLHSLSAPASPDAYRDADRYAHSHGYANRHPPADGHTTAAPTKSDSCADEHPHRRANGHPYAESRADRVAHGDPDDALTAAKLAGSVSQLNSRGRRPLGRRPLLR